MTFAKSRSIGLRIVVCFGLRNSHPFSLGIHVVSVFRKVRHETICFPVQMSMILVISRETAPFSLENHVVSERDPQVA